MKDAVLLSTLKTIAKRQSEHIFANAKINVDKWFYIGCDLDMFYDTLQILGEKLGCLPNTIDYFNITPTKKFLDVGCGTGLTLHIARALGFDAYGIETDEAALSLLQSTHGITDRIIIEDALKYSNYKDYDVVFMYRPFNNEDLQRQLETHIMASMKQHGILIPQHLIAVKDVWVKP